VYAKNMKAGWQYRRS